MKGRYEKKKLRKKICNGEERRKYKQKMKRWRGVERGQTEREG